MPLPQALGSPGTAPALLERLGATLGALHEVAVPEIVLRTSGAALDLVRHLRAATEARGALPETARLVLDEVELEAPPEPERVLCHRDLNPTNVVWTGERFVLLDWETAGAGDGRIDLATVVNWLLLDDARTSSVLAAYARARGQPEIEPGALRPARRLAHAAYAISLLSLVERPLGEIAEDEPPTLARCYEELATGALDMQSDAGRGRLASALLGEYQRL